MATFAKSTFNALSYATFRPTYPPSLYSKVLAYHRGPSNLLLDLGCGHGLISRSLSPHFNKTLGTDPSERMVTQAISSTTESEKGKIEFRQASAEDLGFIEDGGLDMVVAGQAAHWFDYSKVWPELARKVRRGGTLAFWGYKDNTFVDYPKATQVLDEFCYGESKMGPCWELPGRNILRDLYRDVTLPEKYWEQVERVEYEPGTEGKGSGKGEVLMSRRMKLGEMEGYLRTFSAYHEWMRVHPEENAIKDGGRGDICDRMFEKMLEVEPEWKARGKDWREMEVENEWGSVILLARKK